MKKYLASARLSALEKTNGGIIYLLPDIIIKVFTLIPLIFLWRVVMESGAQSNMTLDQLLSYTYASALLADLLVVKTAASGWLSEGVLQKLFGRPISVLGQLAAQTVGGWTPLLLLFSLPMALIAPFFGVNLLPKTPWFFVSLLLCITLGFAVDFLFACLSIKMRSMNWIVSRVRMAITALFSGTIIPISLLPFGIAEVMKYQPFACLGGSPLSLLVGSQSAAEVIALQIIWNLILWPIALFIMKKSQEGMVSYGG